MLDLHQYASLGAALTAALDRWPNETCLIEADRDREKVRLTYSDFKEMARPLCRALEDADFKAGDRAAIIMTNQSKWLISAYAIFFCGGVLVPLDYKLSAGEHLQIWRIRKRVSNRRVLPMARNHEAAGFSKLGAEIVLVTEAPAGVDLRGAYRWEEFRRKGDPTLVARQREDTACIVYSSGTGGRAKGCVLTHDAYLEQCAGADGLVSVLAGRALSEHSAYESCHRFYGGIHWALRLRSVRRASADAAPGVCARRVCALSNHLRQPGTDGVEEPGAGISRQV